MSSPITLIIAIVLLFFFTRAAWNMHKSADMIGTKLEHTNNELTSLQIEKANLASKIDSLSSPSGVEYQLRTKYRAVREGESVAVIIDSSATTSSSSENDTQSGKGWWNGVMSFFGL